jgi:hypothetical protein
MTKVLSQSASVDSSLVDTFEYDHGNKTLKVTFVSGSEYSYKKVPESTFAKALRATSKGRFFNKHIRNKFAFKAL